MEIKKTTDYGIFKTIKGNRDIRIPKVDKLTESIKKRNLLEHFPIVVNEGMKVVDGQHRLFVARELQIPIYYTVINEGNLEDVQLINSNISPWEMENFLKSYIALGKSEYIKLKDFRDKYGIGLMTSIDLLTDSLSLKERDSREAFTSGRFVATNLEKAEKFVQLLLRISAHVEGNFWKSRVFMRSLEIVLKHVDAESLIEKFEEANIKIRPHNNIREYLRDLEEVYNFGQRKNYTRFLGGEQTSKKVVSADIEE